MGGGCCQAQSKKCVVFFPRKNTEKILRSSRSDATLSLSQAKPLTTMDTVQITIRIANQIVKRYINRIENDEKLDRAIQDEVSKVSAEFNDLPDSVQIHGA
jgi:S-adenosylmethionine synthetase